MQVPVAVDKKGRSKCYYDFWRSTNTELPISKPNRI